VTVFRPSFSRLFSEQRPVPKKVKVLKPVELQHLTHATSKDGKAYNALHPVGGVAGLLLQITPSGAKSWIYRTTVGGKRRSIGLGGYPDVTLSQARDLARERKATIRSGIDPVEEQKANKRKLVAAQLSTMTFEDAAKAYIKKKDAEFKNPRQTEQWHSSLATYAYPKLGRMPVADIGLPHIKAVLDPIWETKTETAKRVQARIENILGWSATHGYRSAENPARWQGYLDKVYPSPAKIKKKRHHAALPVTDLPGFMSELRQMKGDAARALEFLILTAARTNEVIGDKRISKTGIAWEEIDFERRVWTVPAERMKSGKEHRVPLSDRAIEILEGMPRQYAHVFTGTKGSIASNNNLSAVLKRMGVSATVHGFRSTFKDWAREYTAYHDEVSELALAHVNSDETRAAYARSQLIEKRRLLMGEWKEFCSNIDYSRRNSNVTPLSGTSK
jgi:integrase